MQMITEKEIIDNAVSKYNVKRFVMMFSGGKDSLATAHFVAYKLNIPIELLYCKTGIGVKENVEYVYNISKKYNWKLTTVEPLEHETYENFVKRFKFPHSGQHSTIMGFLKYHPMRKWYNTERKKDPNSLIALLTGRRRLESKRRMRMKSNKAINYTEKMLFISPIYFWTNSQVWRYIKENDLELSPVYKTLHISGDCLCGAFGNDDEYRFLEIFHPETFIKIRELEEKYNDVWGSRINRPSRNEIIEKNKNQVKLEDFICNECVWK